MDDVESFIAHYGRKGMKWGVVNDDDASSGSSGTVASYKKAAKNYSSTIESPEFQAAALAKHKAKAAKVLPHTKDGPDKDLPPDPTAADLKEGRLSRNQKIALGIGGAVAVAGLAYYGNQHLQKNKNSGPKPIVRSEAEKRADRIDDLARMKAQDPLAYQRRQKHHDEMNALFGTDADSISGARGETRSAVFHAGLSNGRAMDRPEFTIPKGTIFHRLSNHAETGESYDKETYATFLKNDNLAYNTTQEFYNSRFKLTFQSDSDVRVPSTRTVVNEIKRLGLGVEEHGKTQHDDQSAFETYSARIAGGDWGEPQNQRLVQALKDKGYSAVVDDMDAGSIADLPIVYFGGTQKVTATPRTQADVTYASENMVNPTRRYS